MSGIMCSIIRRCSRECVGSVIEFSSGVPICVDSSMCREYDAVMSIDSPNIMIVVGHQLNSDDAIINSPVKFMLGGIAIFIRLVSSHHTVSIGRMLWNPRVRVMMRVLVRSYVVLARQKRADEVNPWAIIRAIAPDRLHCV